MEGAAKSVEGLKLSSFVFSQQTDDASDGLNALARNWCIYLAPNCLGGFVAKFFRGKGLNLLCGGLGRASKNNPLQ